MDTEKTNLTNRILFLSNAPWASTGYGNQMQIFLPRVKALGYEVAICSFYGLQGGVLNWEKGIPVFPPGLMGYGQDIAPAHARHFGAKYLISLIDAWIFNGTPFFDSLAVEGVRWMPWFPVDTEPLAPAVREAVARAYRRLVYSRHAEKMLANAGLDSVYIPHGVDTKKYAPLPQKEARAHLRERAHLDIPDDCFLVGMVAANKGTPSRKAFMPQIEGFAKFKKRHKDAVLYLHTTPGVMGEYGGENLVEYINFLGLQYGKDVIFPDRYGLFMGFPDVYMQNAYSAMDVHLLASMGEGFGIPIVEAQACGVPVIVGDWTAMPELRFAGWQIERKHADAWWTPQHAYQWMPRAEAVADALEMAYRSRGEEKIRKQARQGALEYDADVVTEKYWKPFLQSVFAEDEQAALEIEQAKLRMQKRIATK